MFGKKRPAAVEPLMFPVWVTGVTFHTDQGDLYRPFRRSVSLEEGDQLTARLDMTLYE